MTLFETNEAYFYSEKMSEMFSYQRYVISLYFRSFLRDKRLANEQIYSNKIQKLFGLIL